jgi:hypothetical protein
MATNAGNGGFAGKGVGYAWPIDKTGSFDINSGDLVYFDTSAHTLKPADTDAHMATLVGWAYDSSFLNLYGTKKYDDAIVGVAAGAGRFKTTAGDTYHSGDTCYLGADAQTITNTVGGNTHAIGNIYLPFGNTVTGGTGTLVEMIVLPQYPGPGVA